MGRTGGEVTEDRGLTIGHRNNPKRRVTKRTVQRNPQAKWRTETVRHRERGRRLNHARWSKSRQKFPERI